MHHVDVLSSLASSQFVQMENPYKEPQKACILCNVTVDYKNIQVSLEVEVLRECRVPSNCHHMMFFLSEHHLH